jgi:hypothetical protein
VGVSKELVDQVGLKGAGQQGRAVADELFRVFAGFADEEL